MKHLPLLALTLCLTISFANGCSQKPLSADEIMARAVEAHGGEALTKWQTMVVKGEVHQMDGGRWYRGEYILYAQKPDKLRVERDLTKFERGRFFFSDILNGDKGWMLRNLMPVYRDGLAEQNRARLDRCDGIAYYANQADSLSLAGEETVEGKPTYVLAAVFGDRTVKLDIDKETFYLVQESDDDLTVTYSEFKEFGDSVRASEIREVTSGERSVEIRYTYQTIDFDVPIDSMLFEEDMPT
jgi:outer membrane lipoprotein-sorting protein